MIHFFSRVIPNNVLCKSFIYFYISGSSISNNFCILAIVLLSKFNYLFTWDFILFISSSFNVSILSNYYYKFLSTYLIIVHIYGSCVFYFGGYSVFIFNLEILFYLTKLLY